MFSITACDTTTRARSGSINTAHGPIRTPFYMPVATKGALKYANTPDIQGYDCFISNALIQSFTPGLDVIRAAGGLHAFTGWDRCITTDSGGFQLLSQSFLVRTESKGAIFRNPFSGGKVLITPERLVEIQEILGSDIAMVLDDVLLPGATHEQTFESMSKTHEWARRCRANHPGHNQLLFGIVQGGLFSDLREHSAKYISSLGFDGHAIGGLAIGEPLDMMFKIIGSTIRHLPDDKPRYLMGVGSPTDIVKAIGEGVDMFDSTFPTRNARHGTLFSFTGPIRICNERYKKDFSPIEEGCGCYTCSHHTRAFVHHLLRNNEPTGKRLATVHNLAFMRRLMEECREAIEQSRFKAFRDSFLAAFGN